MLGAPRTTVPRRVGLACALCVAACAAAHTPADGSVAIDTGRDAPTFASRCDELCVRVNRCPALPCAAVSDCECAVYCAWLATAGCDAEFEALFACTSALGEEAYCARACDTGAMDACATQSAAAAACVARVPPSVPDAGCP